MKAFLANKRKMKYDLSDFIHTLLNIEVVGIIKSSGKVFDMIHSLLVSCYGMRS